MKTFRFLDFPVYTQSKRAYDEVLSLITHVSNYSLKDQLSRAALSVVLNIAEGSAKKSDKDFARYLRISIASANEVVACLDIMKDRGWITEGQYIDAENTFESIVKQLGGFIKKLSIVKG